MEKLLGETVVVENKGGAGGSLAGSEVARAARDGHVLLVGTTSTHAINPVAMDKAPYDPVADFTPISLIGSAALVVAVNPKVPAQNLNELIALVRAQPGKFAFGSGGTGSITHVTGELFKSKVTGGLDLQHVPYRGSGQSIHDLVGGQIPVLVGAFSGVLPHHRSGRARILAVTAEHRYSAAPDVPTAAEAGMPGLVAATANFLCGPASMPASVVALLADASRRVLGDAAFRAELEKHLIDPASDASPERLSVFLCEDIARFASVVKAMGIRL